MTSAPFIDEALARRLMLQVVSDGQGTATPAPYAAGDPAPSSDENVGGATGPLLVHVRPGPHPQPLSVQEVSNIVRGMGKRLNRHTTPARIQAAARVAVRIADFEPHQLPLPDISLPRGFPPAAPPEEHRS